MIVSEVYTPTQCPVNASTNVQAQNCIGGFFCTTAGTLTVLVSGVTVVPVFDVTAGVWHPLPFTVPMGATVTFTTGGGAVGVAGTL